MHFISINSIPKYMAFIKEYDKMPLYFYTCIHYNKKYIFFLFLSKSKQNSRNLSLYINEDSCYCCFKEFNFGLIENNKDYYGYLFSINLTYFESCALFIVSKRVLFISKICSTFNLTFRDIYNIFNKHSLKFFLLKFIKLLTYYSKYRQSYIFIDREYISLDNAEYFFDWVYKNSDKNIYFFIKKDTKSYNRLRMKYGNRVIAFNRFNWLIASMHSKYVISSNLLGFITLTKYRFSFKSLFNSEFCFLQHGIIKDFMPSMNRFIADIFCTSVSQEYESISKDPKYPYLYNTNNTFLTGLSRFDCLNYYNSVKDLICIMPTWRSYLFRKNKKLSSQKQYSVNFKESSFFKNYIALYKNIKKLKLGMDVVFVLHPYLRKQINDFINEGVDVVDTNVSINEIVRKSAVFISDYSSVAIDAAYYGCEVIYYHFDRYYFRNNHTYVSGYFKYYRDGFGPVFKDIKTISLYINTKLNLHKSYNLDNIFLSRKKSFFSLLPLIPSKKIWELLD